MLNWIVIGIGDIATRRVIPVRFRLSPEAVCMAWSPAIRRRPSLTPRITPSITPDLTPDLRTSGPGQLWTKLSQMPRWTPFTLPLPSSFTRHKRSPPFALFQRKHVLCEKPMAMNEAEARSMVRAAEESGRTFGVAYYRRSYSKVQRAKQLLEAGVIGRPVVAELTSHGWFDGKEEALDEKEKESQRSWLIDPARAGGGPPL